MVQRLTQHTIGAYYMPVKNQRISADIYYQQMPSKARVQPLLM